LFPVAKIGKIAACFQIVIGGNWLTKTGGQNRPWVLGYLYSAPSKRQGFHFWFLYITQLIIRKYFYFFYLPLFNSITKNERIFFEKKILEGHSPPPCSPPIYAYA
jgi:hypothetical protein